MSDHREMNPDTFAQYEHMTPEELAAVLRADFEADDSSELDSETLLYVIKLYTQKQRAYIPGKAEEAYAEFVNKNREGIECDTK